MAMMIENALGRLMAVIIRRPVCRRFIAAQRGVAAIEFAMIVPIMLVLFFGTVEFSSGVAVDRKVTLVARTLADLASQYTSVATTDTANFFAASGLLTAIKIRLIGAL